MTHVIKPGWGYWDATKHPIGGCFRRVPRDGDPLPVNVESEPQRTAHGYLVKFITRDGRTIWADERAFSPID